jgi:hypothetical protein
VGQLSPYHDWAAGSTTKDLVFDSHEDQDIFLLCKVDREDEGATKTLVQYKARALSLGGKAAMT